MNAAFRRSCLCSLALWMPCTSVSAVDIFYKPVGSTDPAAVIDLSDAMDTWIELAPGNLVLVEVYIRDWNADPAEGDDLGSVASELSNAPLSSGSGDPLTLADLSACPAAFGCPICPSTVILGGIYADSCRQRCLDCTGDLCDPLDPTSCGGDFLACFAFGCPDFWGRIQDDGSGIFLHNPTDLFMSWTGTVAGGATDDDEEHYAGTYVIDVPAGAAGTYTFVPLPNGHPDANWGGTAAYSDSTGAPMTQPHSLGQCQIIIEDEGSCQFYADEATFESAVQGDGLVEKEGEDFEEAEADIGPGAVQGFDDPLDSNTDNEPFQPGDIPENIRFQSNTNGTPEVNDPGATGNNPYGANGLVVVTTGLYGAANTAVLANTFADSFDVMSLGPDNHTAMGMNIVSVFGGGPVEVAVFDKGESLINETTVQLSGNPPTAFLGILVRDTTIGRVNIWDSDGGAEGLYDVSLWLADEPCSLYDMNHDGFVSIIGDVPNFVDCVYFGICNCPGLGCTCPGDCNCDGFLSIIGDVPCFVDCVYFGNCGDCPGRSDSVNEGDGFTIGGAVYEDESKPLLTGWEGVTVNILDGERRTIASTRTAGSFGLWRIDNLLEGRYTAVLIGGGREVPVFRHVIKITVNAENEAANQSIQLLHTHHGSKRPAR